MRKQQILKLIFLFAVALAVTNVSYAQTGRSGKKKKKTRTEMTKRPDQSSEFVDRLWVGGNLADLAFFGNTFIIGVTPVAGYEVNDFLMVGPFVRMAYRFERQSGLTFSTFDVGPGIFARAQVFRDVFVQFDYEAAFLDQPVVPLQTDGERIITERNQQNYMYLGLGYSSGNDRSKFTVSIHYNVLDDIDYVRIPWDVRFGMLFRIGRSPQEIPSKVPSNR